jgi:hypothetical protein
MQPSEAERAAARLKSYTGPAVLVFFLYWLFYLPGLIVNWMYVQEARRTELIAGQRLPGTGCLAFMLWFNALLLVLGIALFVAVAASGAR